MGDTSDQVWVTEFALKDRVTHEWLDNRPGIKCDKLAAIKLIDSDNKTNSGKWQYRARNIDTNETYYTVAMLPVKDMKAGLTNGKPQLSQVPEAAMVYMARGHEYGCSEGKYKRGNYLAKQVDLLADFHRLASYLDAMLRHTMPIALAISRVLGTTDVTEAEMKAAAMCQDAESGLPHLTGMICSAGMAIQQAVDAGLIQSDPGRPWLNKSKN